MTAHKMYGPKGLVQLTRDLMPRQYPLLFSVNWRQPTCRHSEHGVDCGLCSSKPKHSDIVEHTEAMEKLRSHFLKRLKTGYVGRIVVNGPADPSQRLKYCESGSSLLLCMSVCVCVWNARLCVEGAGTCEHGCVSPKV